MTATLHSLEEQRLKKLTEEQRKRQVDDEYWRSRNLPTDAQINEAAEEAMAWLYGEDIEEAKE